MSKWVGESEKAVRMIFKKAKQVSPAIIFLDEIDAIAPRRGAYSDSGVSERMVNQLLTSMDGLEGMDNVVIIGATNTPHIIDPALLRPGRFYRILLLPAPDEPARLKILQVHTKGMPIVGVDLENLAKRLDGFVGADIENLCREAAMVALRQNRKAKTVTQEHFEEALTTVKPSTDETTRQLTV